MSMWVFEHDKLNHEYDIINDGKFAFSVETKAAAIDAVVVLNEQSNANATLQAENERLRQRNAELEAELADHKHDIEVHEAFESNIRKAIQPYAVKFYTGKGNKDGRTIYDHLGDYIGKLEKDALTITAFSLRDFHTGTLIDIPISGLIEHATRQNSRIKELEAEYKNVVDFLERMDLLDEYRNEDDPIPF